MFTFEYPYRVRYADVDQMGFVYYGNYAKLYEIVRVEALRSIGLSYKGFEDQGLIMPVYENYSKYIAPAEYDDLLTLKLFIDKMPRAKWEFRYEITNQNGVLINTGTTVIFFMRADKQKILPAPDVLVEKLKPYFTDK